MKRSLISILLAASSLQSFASPDGYTGLTADGLSTAYGLSQGGRELNPLGWYTIPIRIGIVTYAKTLPDGEGVRWVQAIDSTSWGAAVANLINPVLGIGVFAVLWNKGAEEREFWRMCAREKLESPHLTCAYTKS